MSRTHTHVALTSFFLVACGAVRDRGDVQGLEELSVDLTALATSPTFSAGAMTVVVATGELAVISRHAISGAILVNDLAIAGATAVSVKTISVSGSAGANTVTYAERTGGVAILIVGTAISGGTGEFDTISMDVEVGVGGSGDDALGGADGDQTFYGGAGDDSFSQGVLSSGYLLNGMGNDTFHGGPGIDTVSYGQRSEAVTATMDGNLANDGNPAAGELDNIGDDVENFICPDFVAVPCVVTGNGLDNTITGGMGSDVLSGGVGDDLFVMGSSASAGAGADTISGGAGVDTVTFASFGAVLNVTMTGAASATMGKIINVDVENLTCPSASACTLNGNGQGNHLVGSSALDTIDAMGGDDLIESNGAADVVDCGDGSDIMLGVGVVAIACEL